MASIFWHLEMADSGDCEDNFSAAAGGGSGDGGGETCGRLE